MDSKCISIQSKKHPEARCKNGATKGEFCAKHCRTKIRWIKPSAIITRNYKTPGLKVLRFLQRYINPIIRKKHGPATFTPELSENPHDLYTFESINTIPLMYRFSYKDKKGHIWMFDMRFLIQNLRYAKDLVNHFTQEAIPEPDIARFHELVESLRKSKMPILYLENNELTPEQIWNQKVLDVFLRISSHGYAINVSWFDNLRPTQHACLYAFLYDIWMVHNNLTDYDRERIVPKYRSSNSPLFRWHPHVVCGKPHELKWWRKQNLYVLNAFLTRSSDKSNQGICAIYILTAFARIYPSVRESFPWLAIPHFNYNLL